jgi:hypothetical protein
MINAMFAGLEEDVTLKTVMEVMYGLKPESALDELREMNDENIKHIVDRMELTEAVMNTEGQVIMHDAAGNILDLPVGGVPTASGIASEEKSAEIVNGDDTTGRTSDKGYTDTPSEHTVG